MESSQGRLRARELDLEFTSSGGAHGLPAPGFGIGQGRIRRAEARGDVEMAQQDRSGKGDRAEYLPEQEEIRLYGAPASLFDPRRGLTQGVRLTYHIADDRLLIEGEPGLPTETRWKLHP